MGQIDSEILWQFAAKYIWWKTPREALRYPERVIAQVMDIGDYDDVQKLVGQLSTEYLRQLLIRAEIGQFSPRSWAYWHYRLGLAAPLKVLPVRARRIA
ncbi:MAG: hypothetical protein ACREA0_18310 [bacterium]